mgnify:CR=1 FL=1
MIIANKKQNETTVKEIATYILKKENLETSEHFWGDNWLQICDEDLYQFVDLVFTIANEYHYTSAEEIKTENYIDLTSVEIEEPVLTSLGEFKLTAYCLYVMLLFA